MEATTCQQIENTIKEHYGLDDREIQAVVVHEYNNATRVTWEGSPNGKIAEHMMSIHGDFNNEWGPSSYWKMRREFEAKLGVTITDLKDGSWWVHPKE